jgi:hypothetical protein
LTWRVWTISSNGMGNLLSGWIGSFNAQHPNCGPYDVGRVPSCKLRG